MSMNAWGRWALRAMASPSVTWEMITWADSSGVRSWWILTAPAGFRCKTGDCSSCRCRDRASRRGKRGHWRRSTGAQFRRDCRERGCAGRCRALRGQSGGGARCCGSMYSMSVMSVRTPKSDSRAGKNADDEDGRNDEERRKRRRCR